MSRKSTIDALFGKKAGESLGAPNAAERTVPAVRTGAVAAMGASLQQWTAAQRSSEELQSQLAHANTVIEIDPAMIDPAPVRDRLSIENDPTLEALVRSIESAGQQVPILVRPHPDAPGRFQAAYGHRRIAATKRLGVPVRAIVSDLDESALVTAQGKENGERRDLSFIEKALFARRLEEAKFDRSLICKALSTDKADLSRSIAVARAIPETIIQAIGPAPKAGRARWLELSEHLKDGRQQRRAETAIERPEFLRFDSDRRFSEILKAVGPNQERAQERSDSQSNPVLSDSSGRRIVTRETGSKTSRLVFDEGAAPGFIEYLTADLPEIYQRYQNQSGDGKYSEVAAKRT
jgi:ParB family chromosome partitioning protein